MAQQGVWRTKSIEQANDTGETGLHRALSGLDLTLLGVGGTLTLDQAQLLVETAIDECERFYPVFQFVLWGGKSPTEAIAASLIETRGEA